MNKNQLLKYCEENKIMVPKNATVEQLEAAIVQSSLHKVELRTSDKICFGYWENDNNVCASCGFENRCFKASFGVDKETYFKQLENLENPRLRTTKKRIAKFKKAKL